MTVLTRLKAIAGDSIDAIAAGLSESPLHLHHERHRIAVTGLRRSGKTVFVTAFAHALLNAAEAPKGAFPFFPWRGQVQRVSLEDIPGIPRFPYRERLEELLADPPTWPERTTGLSGLRVRIRYRPAGALIRRIVPVATTDLDLIDYPGEWLLDLPMLGQSFPEWSLAMEELANAPGREILSEDWLRLAGSLDPDARVQPSELARIGAAYVEYIRRCHEERHLHYVQPGRFLVRDITAPDAGTVFFPLRTTGPIRPGTNAAALAARYQAYQSLVRRFYAEVFGRLRRQVVLVDLLTALQNGHDSFADLGLAIRSITDAFDDLTNPLLKLLSLRGPDRLALVATKADHVTGDQLNNLVGLLRDMIGEPFVQANARQSGLFAAASVRATTEVVRKWRGESLPFLLGIPAGRDSTAVEVRPGVIPGLIPDAAQWQALDFRIRQFAPPRLGKPHAQPLPHINLDKLLQFLIA